MIGWNRVVRYETVYRFTDHMEQVAATSEPKKAMIAEFDKLTRMTFSGPGIPSRRDAEFLSRDGRLERAEHLGDKVAVVVNAFRSGALAILAKCLPASTEGEICTTATIQI